MTDVKAILEALKKFESADEGTEIYWKAQDIALEGCKAIADKLQEHKNNLVCELLTILGLNNNDSNNLKKERLIVDEVNANNQEIEMYLDTDYKNRKKACDEINNKFGLNITVEKVKYDWAKEIEAILPNIKEDNNEI